jgi:hypothetical protein
MFLGLHDVSEDGLFAKRLAGFEAVQTVHEDKTIAVAAHENGGFLSALQHALGNLLDYFRLEGRRTFDRNIDACDFEFLPFHHGRICSFQFGGTTAPIVPSFAHITFGPNYPGSNDPMVDVRDSYASAPRSALGRRWRRLVANVPSYAAGRHAELVKHPCGGVA